MLRVRLLVLLRVVLLRGALLAALRLGAAATSAAARATSRDVGHSSLADGPCAADALNILHLR